MGVGKSSLMSQYIKQEFPESPLPTIAIEFATKIIKIKEGGYVKAQIWDTAGQEKYKSLTKLFTKDSKIAILVYAIDDEESFNMLDNWLNLVKSSNEEGIIYAVFANKSDLASENTIPDKKGKEYAKKIGAEWRLTSAKKDGIEELINELFMKYYKKFFSLDNYSDARNDVLNKSFRLSNKAQKSGCC